MGQGIDGSNSLKHIANGINENPKATAFAVVLSGLLLLAINNKDAGKWLTQEKTPTSTADSIAAAKADDKIAASNTTLLMTPH